MAGTVIDILHDCKLFSDVPPAKASLILDGKPVFRQGSPTSNDVIVRKGRVRFRLQPGEHSGRLAGEYGADGR